MTSRASPMLAISGSSGDSIRQSLGTAPPGKLWAYAFGVMKRLWAQGLADEPREAPPAARNASVGGSPSEPRRTAYQAKQDDLMSHLDEMRRAARGPKESA